MGRPGVGVLWGRKGEIAPVPLLLSFPMTAAFPPCRALLVREVNKALLAPPDSR